MINALVFGAAVCVASLAGLALGAGNVGLQQSLRLDPVGFATSYPLAVALSLTAAFTAALFVARARRAPRTFALVGAAGVLMVDVVASFVDVPALIGELQPQDGGIVLLATTIFGLQIVAAWAGAIIGSRSPRPLAAGAG